MSAGSIFKTSVALRLTVHDSVNAGTLAGPDSTHPNLVWRATGPDRSPLIIPPVKKDYNSSTWKL